MREIKFRAWDIDLKRMIFPDIIRIGPTYHINCGFTIDGEDYWEDCEHFILMQFTGLLDKNNKEIYEGDIVIAMVYDYKYNAIEIKWNEKGAFFSFGPYPLDIHGLHDVEIIGNKFENPELLKEG